MNNTLVLTLETAAVIRDRLLCLLSDKRYRHQIFEPSGQEFDCMPEAMLSQESFADDNAPVYFSEIPGNIVLYLHENNCSVQAFDSGTVFVFDDHTVVIFYDDGYLSVLTLNA